MTRPIVLISTLFAFVACKGSSEPSPSAHDSATAPPPAATESAKKPEEDLTEKMRHCPVTLPGIKTELADVEGGVQFVLGASEPDAASAPELVTEARTRAHRLADFTAG